jgi:chromosome segregation ATPase
MEETESMEKDSHISGRLKATLEEMKAKLKEEREASELLTSHLTHSGTPRMPTAISRMRQLEGDLAEAREQLLKQKETTGKVLQQVTAERDARGALLSEASNNIQGLRIQLAEAQAQLKEQREAAERLIQQVSEQKQAAEELNRQLAAEREEERAQYREVELQAQVLQEEFAAAHEQFSGQRDAALQLIRELETQRDDAQRRVQELDANAQELEVELVAARATFQKMFDILKRWNLKSADSITEVRTSEAQSSTEPGELVPPEVSGKLMKEEER